MAIKGHNAFRLRKELRNGCASPGLPAVESNMSRGSDTFPVDLKLHGTRESGIYSTSQHMRNHLGVRFAVGWFLKLQSPLYHHRGTYPVQFFHVTPGTEFRRSNAPTRLTFTPINSALPMRRLDSTASIMHVSNDIAYRG
jgi:hypothetical protein